MTRHEATEGQTDTTVNAIIIQMADNRAPFVIYGQPLRSPPLAVVHYSFTWLIAFDIDIDCLNNNNRP